mmetsp:Transcript_27815/g.46702  ORF Transcript_27815/g.46702 Transcript_27815/m.46702 type:complete len:201 (-) Transcript_27815:262-864(-)
MACGLFLSPFFFPIKRDPRICCSRALFQPLRICSSSRRTARFFVHASSNSGSFKSATKMFEIATGPEPGISLFDLTERIQDFVKSSGIQEGQVLVFSRHTTTALQINEFEPRLLEDIKVFLERVAPKADRYLHNDLHLRIGIPPDEPENAHSHLMACLLNQSEVIPVTEGKVALGTYQSVILLELDGPRKRNFLVQASGI